MSWNNTVTCSWCYKTGHNRNGCEERKKYIAQNPDSYEASIAKQRARKLKNRQCSYCKEEGHNKRTCKHIKADKVKTIQMNKEWRTSALNYFKHLGLGVGALVQFVYKRSWGEDQVENVLVSEVLWENLTFMIKHGANPYSFRCRPLNETSQNRLVDFPMDPAGIVSPNNDYGLAIKVLGPVSGSSIEANVPENWLSGDGDAVDSLFLDSRGKTKERYYIDWIEK